LQKLGQSIEALPLDQLANQALDTLSGIDRAVNAPEIPAILKNLEDMTLNLQQVISRIDQEFAPLIKSLIATSDTARGTLMQLDETISQYKGIPEQITPSIKQAADAIDTAAQQAQDTLASVETLTAEDSPLQSRLQTALNELAAAARSLRIMADYLERHPEALLRGKRY
jgi:paraquat-inducible protein B